MCIVLFTTAHPNYALILINNRDEFVLRPNTRPHWWTHPDSGNAILSSRDIQRAEKGTWLGITKNGLLAVLTNYRESDTSDAIGIVTSRGAMVTAWLDGRPEDSVKKGVGRLVASGVKGVGGFSMVCGKLRWHSEGIAIVSNRAGNADEVPLMGQQRGKVWGLSNTVFDTSKEWPKVQSGKRLLKAAIEEAASNKLSSTALVSSLFSVLDTDTLPTRGADMGLTEYILQLRHSIFIPPIGDRAHQQSMQEAIVKGKKNAIDADKIAAGLLADQPQDPDPVTSPSWFETGVYGTQRQTVMLVDWEGNVVLVERALWDGNGNAIPRGEGDVVFRFQIDGWYDASC